MIDKTRSNEIEFSDKTKTRYLVVMDDHRQVGVTTNILYARAKMESVAKDRKARKISGLDAYVYEDICGPHFISIESAEKIKPKRPGK